MTPRVLTTLPPPRIKLVPPPSQDIRTAGFPACCYAGFLARPFRNTQLDPRLHSPLHIPTDRLSPSSLPHNR